MPVLRPLRWSYGVTTVPSRREDLLPRTLASLRAAGFDAPRLFVDGLETFRAGDYEDRFGLPVTARWPEVRLYGNWYLALLELWIREPQADRFAIFQDDLVTYRNLRGYLDRAPYPPRGYLNLYTFPRNQKLCPEGHTGFYKSDQMGKGAVGLVFDREAVLTLLSSSHMAERPLHADRGWRNIDGGVVEAMRKVCFVEYVHNPSLVQHTGQLSTYGGMPHALAESFRGETYDALEMSSS